MLTTLICLLITCTAQTTVAATNIENAGDTAEWATASIGYTRPASPLPISTNRQVELHGAGAGITGNADSFNFLFAELEGDAVITVRVWDFAPPGGTGKAGLMLRSGLGADAANVLLYVDGEHAAGIQSRPRAGADTTLVEPLPDFGASTWLQLGRWGERIVGLYSTNGFDWQEIGRFRLALGESAFFGLAVTSESPTTLAQATFTDLSLEEDGAEAPPPAGTSEEEATASGLRVASDWVCSAVPLTPTFQPTLYVSPSGSDENDGRSADRPLRTLQTASAMAQAGDVVWVREGVYAGPVQFEGTGTASEPIVFESYPGECAVIEGTSASRRQAVRFENAQHYVFRNFEVRNAPEQGIYLIDSNDILVSHVRSFNNGLSGIQNVGGSRNHFTYFIVHDNSDGTRGDADGIGISSGVDNRIDNCVSFRNSDDGIDAWRSHRTVIERCISFENGFQGGNGNGFKAGGGLPDGDAILRNNIAFDNKSEGFTYNAGHGILFEYNTSYNNGAYGFSAAKSTLNFNLAYGNDRGDWMDDGDNDQVGNSWNLSLTDPDFLSVDPRAPDFLSPDTENLGLGNEPDLQGSKGLGAIPFGETITTFLRIDIGKLLGF